MSKLIDLILWPGTYICERLGLDPTADSGLMRSLFNMVLLMIVGLAVVWYTF